MIIISMTCWPLTYVTTYHILGPALQAALLDSLLHLQVPVLGRYVLTADILPVWAIAARMMTFT